MANTTLMKCSRCQRVKYCDRACQKAHWPTHKQDCHDSRMARLTTSYSSLRSSDSAHSALSAT